jgi:hypothetical protein
VIWDLQLGFNSAFKGLINPFQKYDYLLGQMGSKTVLVRTTGHEKLRAIMMLSILADWWILTPFVCLKRNSHQKKTHSGIVFHCIEKMWITEEIMVK